MPGDYASVLVLLFNEVEPWFGVVAADMVIYAERRGETVPRNTTWKKMTEDSRDCRRWGTRYELRLLLLIFGDTVILWIEVN